MLPFTVRRKHKKKEEEGGENRKRETARGSKMNREQNPGIAENTLIDIKIDFHANLNVV